MNKHIYTCTYQQEQTPSYLPSYTRLGHAIPGSKTVSVGGRCVLFARAQTTTLCVQEVEIYLERWEVLGALVDVCVERRKGS